MKILKSLFFLGLASLTSGALAQNVITIPSFSVDAGEEVEVEVLIENESEVASFNFDLILPVELLFSDYGNTSRTKIKASDKFTISVDDSNDGALRVSAYYQKTKMAPGNEAAMTFTFEAVEDYSGDLVLNNANVTSADAAQTQYKIGEFGPTGYLSYSCIGSVSKNLVISGANAYYGTVSGDELVLSAVEDNKLLAGEAAILTGTPGASVYALTTLEELSKPSNDLIGTSTGVDVTGQNVSVLAAPEGKIGFYKYNGTWIVNGKAYLEGVSSARIVFDTEEGIENINAEQNVETIFNLQGQKMTEAKKGINIVNGKKVMY